MALLATVMVTAMDPIRAVITLVLCIIMRKQPWRWLSVPAVAALVSETLIYSLSYVHAWGESLHTNFLGHLIQSTVILSIFLLFSRKRASTTSSEL